MTEVSGILLSSKRLSKTSEQLNFNPLHGNFGKQNLYWLGIILGANEQRIMKSIFPLFLLYADGVRHEYNHEVVTGDFCCRIYIAIR